MKKYCTKEKIEKWTKKKNKKDKKEKETEEKIIQDKPAESGQTKLVNENGEELTARGQKRGNVTILLFYAYVRPVWTNEQQDEAINFCYQSLQRNECTGRLRVAREGFNAVLTGSYDGIRRFTSDIRKW